MGDCVSPAFALFLNPADRRTDSSWAMHFFSVAIADLNECMRHHAHHLTQRARTAVARRARSRTHRVNVRAYLASYLNQKELNTVHKN